MVLFASSISIRFKKNNLLITMQLKVNIDTIWQYDTQNTDIPGKNKNHLFIF